MDMEMEMEIKKFLNVTIRRRLVFYYYFSAEIAFLRAFPWTFFFCHHKKKIRVEEKIKNRCSKTSYRGRG